MDEYISRHEAIRAVQLSYGNYEATRKAIFELPAADVAPVRRGRWTMSSDRPDTIICSCCDNAFDVWKADIRRHHYCPNCGARMDGAENE
nr:MAG TPA: RimK-related lysine biosynthesis protein, Probable-dependent amine/thiol ligase family Amino-group [Caudoviricetes sp.]DAH95017.1 MAG TPA: RimK-related lysine biosynthesis protein, Probable-dependent amine/thiol ligase family Amino-group [Caudoviricetes sp.]